MNQNKRYIALDVGEKRIGVAAAESSVPIARPLQTIVVDGKEYETIQDILESEQVDVLVIGYPRNQSGDPTAQTHYVEQFAEKIDIAGRTIVFQDESLTSVLAESRLKSYGKPYTKADIDAAAATIILQDYLDQSL